jgi:hypothetical protein
VIENPERMPRLHNKEALACLAQLRQLRVVNRQHGGGTIDLNELQCPWTQEDDDRVQGMCITAWITTRNCARPVRTDS